MPYNKIMDNRSIQAYNENMPEPEWHIAQIDGYLKMLLKWQQRTSFSSTAKDLAETKFKKINVYLHGEKRLA